MFAKIYQRTPEEAKREKTAYYAPDKVCERGHLAVRRVEDGKCVRCIRIEEQDADCRD